MTVGESLKKRASFLIIGGASFALALGVTRYFGDQPLLQPQSDLGIALGLVLVMLYFVHNDTREDSGSDHASKTGLN